MSINITFYKIYIHVVLNSCILYAPDIGTRNDNITLKIDLQRVRNVRTTTELNMDVLVKYNTNLPIHEGFQSTRKFIFLFIHADILTMINSR